MTIRPAVKLSTCALALVAGLVSGTPALADKLAPYVGRPSELSVTDAALADAGTAIELAQRQLALPPHVAGDPLLLLAAIAFAVLLVWPARLWLLSRLGALVNRSHRHTSLAIYAKAIAAIVVTTISVEIAANIVFSTIERSLRLLPETRAILSSLADGAGLAGLGLGIGRALRSPEDKTHRPVQMPSGLGRAIGFYSIAAGLMLGLTAAIDQTSRVLQATSSSWALAQGLIIVAEIVIVGRFLIQAGKARERQMTAVAAAEDVAAVPSVFGLTALAWLALVTGFGALVLGHTRFAMLIVQELLWAGLILTTAWLVTRFLDALVTRLFDTERRAGRFATTVVGLGQARLAQMALIGSALLTVLVWIAAVALVAAPLQGDGTAVAEQIRPSPLAASLRSLNISPRGVVVAIAVLFGGIALTRAFRRWLESRFLPATQLDVGARSSIATGFGYLGIIVAMLGATNALGVQIEKITLIASALSVGIGFGLQSIIQNFVSGLILLIERPVKLGDWVTVSGAEGNIRRIRVRATELATADGGTSIVPNSAFISSTVVNHADTLMSARLELGLQIGGTSSAEAARDVLENIVVNCEVLRQEPRPRLYLRTLGGGEWKFDLKAYGQPGCALPRARSDLLFWISGEAVRHDVKIVVT